MCIWRLMKINRRLNVFFNATHAYYMDIINRSFYKTEATLCLWERAKRRVRRFYIFNTKQKFWVSSRNVKIIYKLFEIHILFLCSSSYEKHALQIMGSFIRFVIRFGLYGFRPICYRMHTTTSGSHLNFNVFLLRICILNARKQRFCIKRTPKTKAAKYNSRAIHSVHSICFIFLL